MSQNSITASVGSYLNATGVIEYGMTNDYMFHAVLQKNVKVLKGLTCSLLGMKEEEVKSVYIMNPIELGSSIIDKTFVLDIKVMLNDNTVINLEMQMENEQNWEERSLSYLCRSFDQLYRGQKYIDVKPAIHIGFLNFTPIQDTEEFYATYKMLNVRNHRTYSDKFILSVVDLTHIELATEEDKQNQLDFWAKLFTATSWEELKMIAEKNPSMSEATQTLYELNADEITQEMCYAREEYQRRQRTMKRDIMRAEERKAEAEKAQAEAEKAQAKAEEKSAVMEKELIKTQQEKAVLEKELADMRQQLAELQKK